METHLKNLYPNDKKEQSRTFSQLGEVRLGLKCSAEIPIPFRHSYSRLNLANFLDGLIGAEKNFRVGERDHWVLRKNITNSSSYKDKIAQSDIDMKKPI